MNSSGTSGSNTSKIYIDKENAKFKPRSLKQSFQILLAKRLPMLIIDSELELKKSFSARAAGIVGFSIFGKRNILP